MSDFTIEAKNRLAKLLATENFSIEHKQLKTAYFDIKNRVLYCPIWKNMGADLYDMLLSHEASHAIYTDYSEWDTILKSNPSKDYCNFLNSIEDDRVNRKIQRKYPGLRSAYISGYKYLIDRDFFGTVNIDVNSMYFIDKLNIYSKSQYKNNNIKFTDYEWELIDAVKSTETLNDVKRVTDLVWDYSKKEQQNKQEQQEQQEQNNNKDIKVDDESTDESTDEDYTEEYTIENDVGDESIDEELTEEVDDDTSIDDESTEDDDGEQTGGESLINNTNDNNDFEPTCATEKAFNDSSAKLINNNAKEHLYINVPTPILENIITPHNIVYKQIKEYYDQFPVVTQELLNDLLAEFKSVNDSYIGLLVKEFEMKKAATKYSKTKVSNTGDIDIDKISSYKVNDDIFKRMTKTNNGKSHGLFLLLDRSGSMAESMSGAIEQIIVLTMFCKRVNIPFVVYGFGNNQDVKVRDYRAAGDTSLKFDEFNSPIMPLCFTSNDMDLSAYYIYLREYLSSDMTPSQYTQAIKYLLLLKLFFDTNFGKSKNINTLFKYNDVIRFPKSEDLSGTPLVGAIIASATVNKMFRKKYNLDVVNTVLIHDGQSHNYYSNYYTNNEEHHYNNTYFKVYLKDTRCNFNMEMYSDKNEYTKFELPIFRVSLEWYKKYTNSNIIGFYITPSSVLKKTLRNMLVLPDGKRANYHIDMDTVVKKFKTDNYLRSYNRGYSNFYFIPGDTSLNITNDELEIPDKCKTVHSIYRIYSQYKKKRIVSRILVTNFINNIAV